MANLLALANQLKEGITAKNAGIVTSNKELAERVKTINATAQQILEKVRGLAGNSQVLQQNIETQAAEIARLKDQLETASREQAEKQAQIDDLNKRLLEAQGQGRDADALRQQMEQLQQEGRANAEKIQQLTKEISDSTTEVQSLIGSLNSPEAQQSQAELNELISQLEHYITDINAALPAPAAVERNIAEEQVPSPRQGQVQRQPTERELRIIQNAFPTPAEGLARNELMRDPTLADWKKANPKYRGGYVYKQTRKSRSSSSGAPSTSSSKRTSSKRTRKRGGSRRTRRVKAILV